MNWYRAKLAAPVVSTDPQSDTYFDVGHEGGRTELWYIDPDFNVHSVPGDKFSGHYSWPDFRSSTPIAYGRYDAHKAGWNQPVISFRMRADWMSFFRAKAAKRKALAVLDRHYQNPTIKIFP